MPYININTGSFDNDPSADKIRVAFNKSKSMFAELYTMFGDIVFDLDGVGVANVVQIPYNPISNSHTEAENIANSINNCPFVIDVPQGQLIFVRCVIGNAGQTPGVISFVTVTYMILNGSGTYGTMQPQIPPDRVLKIEQEIISETNNYDLGDIGGADIWDYVNFNGPYAVSGTTTFTTSDKVYVFVGAEGLYGVDNLQTTSANFIEITEGAVVSNSDLPPKQIAVDTYNLADSDLYRQLYFTEENTQLTIPDAYTSTNASYYFRVYFAGSGSHSVTDDETAEVYNFEQGDYVLCEKKYGLNGWIVKKVGGGSVADTSETVRAWATPPDEDVELEDYYLFTATEEFTLNTAIITAVVAPTGDSITAQITKNGTPVTGVITIDISDRVSNLVTYSGETFDPGDVVGLEITQKGSTIAGKGIIAKLNITNS